MSTTLPVPFRIIVVPLLYLSCSFPFFSGVRFVILTTWELYSSVHPLLYLVILVILNSKFMSLLITQRDKLHLLELVPSCKVPQSLLSMPFLLDFIFKKQQHIFPNEGVPANPRRDHEWITKRETKLSFCMRMFSMMPSFFHHHQIDLAQRDGHNMLLDQILEDCFLLILGVDYAQNYGHISQVLFSS